MTHSFDIIIAGAGPSGLSCAIGLKNSGLKVALIDKDIFPRDKICGDGLTLDTLKQIPLISEGLAKSFFSNKNKRPSHGVKVFAVNGKSVSIHIKKEFDEQSMYVIKRYDFDNIFMEYIKQNTDTHIFENCYIKDVKREEKGLTVSTSCGEFNTKMIIGAEGANSIVAKRLHPHKIKDNEKYFAVRGYYKNLNIENNELLHFYFVKKIMPGGLWVFPENDNIFNVGLGMRFSIMKRKKINLKEVLEEEINVGILKDIFKGSQPMGNLKGHMIPVGKSGRIISGNNYLLTGDAAGLANSLSGEGIGNALRSGRVAATHIKDCFKKNNFSQEFNQAYDKEIYRRMGKEFKNYELLERINKYNFLNNYLIGKVAPRFSNVFSMPQYVNKIQSEKYFLLKVLKYMFFKKQRI